METGRSITQQRGDAAERQAATFLEGQGLTLIARNYRCRGGEIDLIAQDGDTLVFVEVRARHHTDYGGAAASITHHKQQRLIYAARHYLMLLPNEPLCRFDAILIEGPHLEWLRSAFDGF
ncbi:MAG: YraN family protein [Betaproteobacteria bacterium]|nr:YraN family protein [Betaproteobacteria bacterium]